MIDKNLISKIKACAQTYPDQIAITANEISLSYSTLISIAETWARILLQHQRKTKLTRVLIIAERSVSAMIGILAALFAGAAYVPINVKSGLQRNLKIIENVEADAMLVPTNGWHAVKELSDHIQLPASILCVCDDGAAALFADVKEKNLPLPDIQSCVLPNIAASDLAYILYTSGSTGTPKAVPITHANVCSFIEAAEARYNITHTDKLSQTFELTFDLAGFDIFMSWCHGATLCLMRAIDLLAPANYINNNAISVWFSVPSVIRLLQKQNFLEKNSLPNLRLSLFCGEPITLAMLSAWADAAPNSVCENLYGPTELTIACSAYTYQRQQNNLVHHDIVSLGKIFSHLRYHLLSNGTTDIGELCVAGAQCFKGYLSNDVANAFIEIDGEKFYRTGDFVKQDSHKNLFFCGREDQQIKLHGFRIELGEIESIFNQMQQIDRSVVMTAHEKDEMFLVAYVVGTKDIAQIEAHAKANLPHYMLPKRIYCLDEFPLNANGKIDRKALSKMIGEANARI